LLPATIEKVHTLVKGISDEREKIKLIYKYLQSKTRYVSIQLGIGGWQPIEASVVDQVGYGDCKALSNYAISLLKEAGIKAYFALVNSGSSFTQIRETFLQISLIMLLFVFLKIRYAMAGMYQPD